MPADPAIPTMARRGTDGRATAPPDVAARRFHWAMIVLLFLSNVATHIDARNHAHHGFEIESFFVAPHYLLYGTWLMIAGLVIAYTIWSIRQGRSRTEWLPPGYGISALGVALYFLAGGLDLLWHERFGFEQNFDVTLSPSHLLLVAAGFITAMGVVRHELDLRPLPSPTARSASPILVLGIAFLLVRVMWFSFYFDPLSIDFASGGAVTGGLDAVEHLDLIGPTAEIAGVVGALLVTAIWVPFIIVPLLRWRLPVGSVTFILLYQAAFRVLTMDTYVYLPAAIGAGVVGDGVWAWMRRGGEERSSAPLGYIVMGALMPVAFFAVYFAVMAALPAPIVWPVNLWAGTIALSGATGLMLAWALTWPLPLRGSREASDDLA